MVLKRLPEWTVASYKVTEFRYFLTKNISAGARALYQGIARCGASISALTCVLQQRQTVHFPNMSRYLSHSRILASCSEPSVPITFNSCYHGQRRLASNTLWMTPIHGRFLGVLWSRFFRSWQALVSLPPFNRPVEARRLLLHISLHFYRQRYWQ